MNKERLEWVMSGLNQHALTKAEDQFLKTALEDFDKNEALTEHQEEKLEMSCLSRLSRTGKLANREVLPLWRCPLNGKAGELSPC